ncbi:MAG: fructosamine kinase family protein [Bradymonadaceae bacterium]
MKTPAQTMLENALGVRPSRLQSLTGGCVATVYRADMTDGSRVVAKVETGPSASLSIEGMMLRYLKENTDFPVPEVLHCSDELLVMDFIDNDGTVSVAGQKRAAELVADLHSHSAAAFGFDYDTLIGPLHQPNPWISSWSDFFAEERLMYMGGLCVSAGRMETKTLSAIENLCARLDTYLEPGPPSLIHGDIWGGNVLFRRGDIVAFIDPAIYFGDPEIELAYTTLFSTFDDAFYKRYDEIRPIRDGFFEARKDIYNLYPLLVHVRLFGGSYLDSVQEILRRL